MEKAALVILINKKLSQREIAEAMGLSQTTVRYWMEKYGLKTLTTRYRPIIDKDRYIQRKCKHHGVAIFIFEPSKNGYRCRACRSGRVSEDRRRVKRQLVKLAGGKCQRCGYRQSIWSLEFHHRNARDKKYSVGNLIRDRNLELAKQEIKKCDLLCANCHGEVEETLWKERKEISLYKA